MALSAMSGIFGAALTDAQSGGGSVTTVAGDLVIPSGTITSYIPAGDASAGDPSEFIFGMCETMVTALTTPHGGLTNCTGTSSQTLTEGGSVLRKTYTFTVNLDFSGNNVGNLNVKDES